MSVAASGRIGRRSRGPRAEGSPADGGGAPAYCGPCDLGGHKHLWEVMAVRTRDRGAGVADLPLVSAVGQGRGRIVALLVHAAVLVVAWFIAFAVWAPFVDWE